MADETQEKVMFKTDGVSSETLLEAIKENNRLLYNNERKLDKLQSDLDRFRETFRIFEINSR